MKPTSSGKTDIKEFPENPKYKERKTALTKFDVIKAEIIILVAAFALPFLMALVYAVVSDYTMAEVFSRAGRIAALGGVLFFCYGLWRGRGAKRRGFSESFFCPCCMGI